MRHARTILVLALCAAPALAQVPEQPVSRPSREAPQPVVQEPAPKPTSRPTEQQPRDPAKPAPESDTEVVGVDDKEAEDLPAGLDPADIAAMKSARAMLDAEKRLKAMLDEGKIEDVDRILTFEELSSWPYEDGLTGMPKAVKKLHGQKVMMVGFMLPIDEVENIKEFLLVQSLWSCCYGQPPDINGIVRVVMKGKSRIDYQFDPIKIIGDFKVEAAYEEGYCLDIYQLHVDSVEAIR